MIAGLNKDVLFMAAVLTVAAVCAFLYKENLKSKEELASVKSFSINLANRIPVKPIVSPVVETPEKATEEEIKEE